MGCRQLCAHREDPVWGHPELCQLQRQTCSLVRAQQHEWTAVICCAAMAHSKALMVSGRGNEAPMRCRHQPDLSSMQPSSCQELLHGACEHCLLPGIQQGNGTPDELLHGIAKQQASHVSFAAPRQVARAGHLSFVADVCSFEVPQLTTIELFIPLCTTPKLQGVVPLPFLCLDLDNLHSQHVQRGAAGLSDA